MGADGRAAWLDGLQRDAIAPEPLRQPLCVGRGGGGSRFQRMHDFLPHQQLQGLQQSSGLPCKGRELCQSGKRCRTCGQALQQWREDVFRAFDVSDGGGKGNGALRRCVWQWLEQHFTELGEVSLLAQWLRLSLE